MKILVTGSSGRIGSAICARLAGEHEVVGLDRVPAPPTSLVGDIGDEALLRRALEGVQAVVHTAALHAPQVGRCADAEFRRVNVEATRLLAQLAARAGIRRFVFTSTTALYGHASNAAPRAAWIDEDVAPQPRTIYHSTKLAAERLLASLPDEHGIAVTALRMSRCFPEPAPLMASYRLHRGVDARDVADAHELALQLEPAVFRTFVISGTTPFRAEDAGLLFRDAAAAIRGRVPELARAFSRRGWALPASIDRVYSPARAIAELGWRPRYGFEEVLAQLDAGSAEVLR